MQRRFEVNVAKTEKQQAPELPEVRTLALGELPDFYACVAWLTTRGDKVTGWDVVYHGDRDVAENVWSRLSYEHFRMKREWTDADRARLTALSGGVVPTVSVESVPRVYAMAFFRQRSTCATLKLELEHGRMLERPSVLHVNTDSLCAWDDFVLEGDRMLRWESARRVA